MDNLLKYLIRKLYTLDGTKGTANAVVNLHHKAAVDKSQCEILLSWNYNALVFDVN